MTEPKITYNDLLTLARKLWHDLDDVEQSLYYEYIGTDYNRREELEQARKDLDIKE